MLLSICVPTYNRGQRALYLVKQLCNIQDRYPDDIEIVVSNNGSTKYIDEYNEISKIAKEREFFTYNCFEKNMQYVGNYSKVISLAKGDFCLLISDEDIVNEENVEFYLTYLKNNPNIGMVRARTSAMYYVSNEQEKYSLAGDEAIDEYFLKGNYISGIIYNRKIVTDEVLDLLKERYGGNDINRAYQIYPHLLVETLVLLNCDFYRCDKLLIIEGKEEEDINMAFDGTIPEYGTWEDRLRQFEGYLAFFKDLNCDDTMKMRLIFTAIVSTFLFIKLQKDVYIKAEYDWDSMIYRLPTLIIELIDKANIEIASINRELVQQFTQSYVSILE